MGYTDTEKLIEAAVKKVLVDDGRNLTTMKPMMELQFIPRKRGVWLKILESVAKTLEDDRVDRMEFVQANQHTKEAFLFDVFITLSTYIKAADKGVLRLPLGLQTLISINPHTPTRGLVILITSDDPAVVYGAASQLIRRAWKGPFPKSIANQLKKALKKALEHWKNNPPVFSILSRLNRIPWDQEPFYHWNARFHTPWNAEHRIIFDAIQKTASMMEPDDSEDTKESLAKGGAQWAIRVLDAFGWTGVFINAVQEKIRNLDEESREHFLRVYRSFPVFRGVTL